MHRHLAGKDSLLPLGGAHHQAARIVDRGRDAAHRVGVDLPPQVDAAGAVLLRQGRKAAPGEALQPCLLYTSINYELRPARGNPELEHHKEKEQARHGKEDR